ncbi:MAG TPA: sugar ABC transporter permease [Firmicutes bacterium]|jgi:multiple sugar transport system permease protein|nr:sugar ABC transporter permease [Bacillota bacterium]
MYSSNKPDRLRSGSFTSQRYQDILMSWGFLLPTLFILAVILIWPLCVSLKMSFFHWELARPDLGRPFVWFENYIQAFTDDDVIHSLNISAFFVIISLAFELIFGFIAAFLLAQKVKGIGVFRVLILLPMMLPDVVVGLMWKLLFDSRNGIINYFLSLLGIPQQIWMGANLAFPLIIMAEVWQQTSFFALILLAGLQAIPEELYEASKIDGATYWQELRYITLPILKPVMLVALIFRTMFTMRVFAPIWVLTGGGPGNATNLLSLKIYQEGFSYYNMGYAAALSWILLILTVIITYAYIKVLFGKEEKA